MTTLNKTVLTARSGQFDAGSVQRLNLGGLALANVQLLAACTSLHTLSLKGNQLSKLSGLEHLPAIRSLDLSGNRLTDLSALRELTSLEHLSLQGNKIADIGQFDNLSNLVNLRSINFKDPDGRRANPVCEHPAYFTAVQKMLGQHKLLSMDGEALLLRDAAQKLLMESAKVEESELDLPEAEEWAEEREFRLPPKTGDHSATMLENDFSASIDEAKALEAQAAVLMSKIRAEAAAKRRAAKEESA